MSTENPNRGIHLTSGQSTHARGYWVPELGKGPSQGLAKRARLRTVVEHATRALNNNAQNPLKVNEHAIPDRPKQRQARKLRIDQAQQLEYLQRLAEDSELFENAAKE